MYNSKSSAAADFINHEEILNSLEYADKNKNNTELLYKLLGKAASLKGLDYKEVSVLLASSDNEITEKIFMLASEIKNKIYGRRVVLFAPLYLSNYCVNGCLYCAYHNSNCEIARKRLTQDEIKKEVIALQDLGHKRLALEAGEDKNAAPIDYITESIRTIYSIKHKNGAIRRVNVNIAATTEEDYKKLLAAEIGTYILFQETYHKETYRYMHPTGPKSNYEYHTEAMDRAMRAGIDDVGIGVLFGLYDFRYDTVALMMHIKHLEDSFGVGPHTISLPRIRPASDVDLPLPYSVSDDDFKKITAILRIAVPYTGIIISTRESVNLRTQLLKIGVSQVSGGSRTGVGGYSALEMKKNAQFEVADHRTLNEIVNWLCEEGYIPSFCTACYREGRTGERFMRLAKTGQIGNVCQSNALLTLNEYKNDYADENTIKSIENLTKAEILKIPNEKVRLLTAEYLGKIGLGERDFRF